MKNDPGNTAGSGMTYRNMIRLARRQGDPELERLLRQRLRGGRQLRTATEDGCEVIRLTAV